MKKGLEYIVIASVFSITALPLLVFDGLFFPFITSKAFVFRLAVEIGIAALLILAIEDRRYIPRITPVTVFFGAFVVALFIADLFGANIVRSVWSNFERMEGWITIVHLFGAFLLFERVFSVSNLWKRWIQTSLGISFLVGVHGIVQLLGYAEIHQGGVRLDANFGNATYLAVYTLFHVFFALWLACTSKGVLEKFIYGGLAVLNAGLLYFTATRGALLGLIAGVVISLFVYALLSRNKKVFVGLGIFVVLTGASFLGLTINKESTFVSDSPVLSRIASISLEAGETRFAIWGIALEGFVEKPILGWGQGNFNLIFSKYYKPSLYDQEPWFDRAHNVYLDWLVAGGVIGLGAYLLLFGSLVYFLLFGNFTVLEKSFGFGVLAAYAVNNLFVFDNLLSYIFFVFVAALISSRINTVYAFPKLEIPKNILISLVLIFGILVIYFVNVPALNANGALLRALNPQHPTAQRQEFFKEALLYKSFADQEIREQMVQLALSAVRQENVPLETKISLLVAAATEMQKQAVLMPESARIHLLYGVTLRLLGENNKAYEVLKHAKSLAPKKQSVLFEFAFAAEALGKKEEALETLRYTYELDPSYEDAGVLYEEMRARIEK